MENDKNQKILFNEDFYGEVTKKHDFKGFQIINNTFSNFKTSPKHFHSNNYLCYLVSGEFITFSENKSALCTKGDFFIQPAGMKHYNNFSSKITSCINFSFDNEYLKFSNCDYLFDSFQKIQNFQMNGIIDKIIHEILSFDDFSILMIEGLMLELIGYIEREKNISQNDSPKWLQKVIEYLYDDYSIKYRMIDLAQIACIHPSYMVNAFKNYTNQTIGEYLRNIRVKNACIKLNSNLSIAQIALDCGFSDQSHLNRSFKKVIGMTPLTYRKKVLSN